MWEKKYLIGGLIGWVSSNGDILYSVNRNGYEVILNSKTIKRCNSFEEADEFIEEYMNEH